MKKESVKPRQHPTSRLAAQSALREASMVRDLLVGVKGDEFLTFFTHLC
jgi:hypothetical protein